MLFRNRRPSAVKVLGCLTAIAATLTVAACGGSSSAGSGSASGGGASAAATGPKGCKRPTGKTIGVDYPLTSIALIQNLEAFARIEAKKRGYKVEFTNDNTNLQQQITNVQTWVSSQIPAITSYPLEPASMEPLAAQVQAYCGVFVSYATPMKNQTADILFSGTKSGNLIGDAALKWAKDHPKVQFKALLLQDENLAVGKQRDAGVRAVFPDGAKNVQIIGVQNANDASDGNRITSTVLTAHPDLNMVIAYDDDVASGAMQAFLSAGKSFHDPNIWIGGQDGSQQALQQIQKNGIYRATSALNIRDLGFALIDVPADNLEGKKDPGLNEPPKLITAKSPQLRTFLGYYNVK